jgi:excisionase family DNA binding protein
MSQGQQDSAGEPLTFDVSEVCTILSVSRRTLYKWIAEETFPAPSKIGGLNRWLRSDVLEWVDRQFKSRDSSRERA